MTELELLVWAAAFANFYSAEKDFSSKKIVTEKLVVIFLVRKWQMKQ